MQKQSGNIIMAVLIAITILITGVFFYIQIKKQYITPNEKQSNPTSSLKAGSTNPQYDKEMGLLKFKLENLQNGKIKLSDQILNIELIYPDTFKLLGEQGKFVLIFQGPHSEEGPGPRDFASLSFTGEGLKGGAFSEFVKEDFKTYEENQGHPVNYNDLKPTQIGQIAGFSYKCDFLVNQNCIYIPLKNNSKIYLHILKNYADEDNKGYLKSLDEILLSVKYSN